MSTLRGSLLGIGIGILICLGVSAYWLSVELDRALGGSLRLESQTNYLVEPGTNIARIARDLSGRRILDRPVYLVWHARMSGKSASIKAGEYALSPGMTAVEMLDLFVSGRVVQRSFTIVEGWTFQQLFDAIRNSPSRSSRSASPSQAITVTSPRRLPEAASSSGTADPRARKAS